MHCLNNDTRQFVFDFWRLTHVRCMMHEMRQKTHMVYLYTIQCSPDYVGYSLPTTPPGALYHNRRLLAQPSYNDALYDKIRINRNGHYWSVRYATRFPTSPMYSATCTLAAMYDHPVLPALTEDDQKNWIARLTKKA